MSLLSRSFHSDFFPMGQSWWMSGSSQRCGFCTVVNIKRYIFSKVQKLYSFSHYKKCKTKHSILFSPLLLVWWTRDRTDSYSLMALTNEVFYSENAQGEIVIESFICFWRLIDVSWAVSNNTKVIYHSHVISYLIGISVLAALWSKTS